MKKKIDFSLIFLISAVTMKIKVVNNTENGIVIILIKNEKINDKVLSEKIPESDFKFAKYSDNQIAKTQEIRRCNLLVSKSDLFFAQFLLNN